MPVRRALAVPALLLAAACSSLRGGGGGAPLPAEAFPLGPSEARFEREGGAAATVRVEPAEATEGQAEAIVRVEVPGAPAVEWMHVTRRGASLWFAAGPEGATELLRVGAVPGASWESGGARVRFDGWERVEVPAGTYDAARVTTRHGPRALETVETWWFAPGVGLVRLRTDRAGIITEEMRRASP